MKQNVYIALIFLLSSSYSLYAQFNRYYFKKHEVGVLLKAGLLQNYGNLPDPISPEFKGNVAFGIQYDYYLNHKWSLGIGGQYAKQTSDFIASNLKGQNQQTDFENENFIFSYDAKKYKEEWKVSQLNIPLTVNYVGNGETALYVRTGIQYSLIMSSKATLTWNNLQTSGYFPQYNLLLDEALLYAGFDFQDQVQYKPDLKLKDRWAWIGEIGLKYNIKENQNLYIGLYFDLGLNNQKPEVIENKEELIAYQPIKDDALLYNSIQESSKAVFKNYNFGIQLRYAIGL